jgi:hypothetical protein
VAVIVIATVVHVATDAVIGEIEVEAVNGQTVEAIEGKDPLIGEKDLPIAETGRLIAATDHLIEEIVATGETALANPLSQDSSKPRRNPKEAKDEPVRKDRHVHARAVPTAPFRRSVRTGMFIPTPSHRAPFPQ